MQALDPRIIKVSIEVNGIVKTYEDVAISATGTKYANALQNEAEVKITNYDTVTNEFLITQTTPFNKNKTPKVLTLYAGRQSYGVSRVFTGNIADAKIARGDSQPDQVLTLKCLTGNYKKGFLVSNTQPGLTNLSTVAKQVADNLDLGLEFHAKDSDVANYTYSGAALKQVDALGDLGQIDAYIDDGMLVVKDEKLPLPNRLRVVDENSGMIGIPELTETGIRVKFLLDNVTTLGGGLRVQSKMFPGVNGDYAIYKLSFDIANRDTPFYWIAEGVRL